jgi:rfaE bifunctional protein kinase chain/domain
MLPNQIVQKIKELHKIYYGQKVVFVSGNFNIIHPGHLRVINFARTCGDKLVIGLFADEEPEVIIPYTLRQESLESLEAVDAVLPLRSADLSEFLAMLRPDAVVKGKEHEDDINPERDVLRSYGGHLIFSAGEARFSSIDLIRRELTTFGNPSLLHDYGFLNSHGTSLDSLSEIVNRFSDIKAVIVGDLIVDEYIHCDPLGMSQEDPSIVVTPLESRTYTGGAGIVAGHVASLGADTTYISVTGDDATSTSSKAKLGSIGINAVFFRDSSRPTTLKQRYRAGGKTLLRVSHLRSHDIEDGFVEAILSQISKILPTANLVIFSDFNYGCLPQKLVDKIIDSCKANNVPYVADSQASSQVGDVSRYRDAALISATEREIRMAVNDFKSGLQNVANKLNAKAKPEKLIVKLGAEGLLAMTKTPKHSTDLLRSMNPQPVDVAGAGDALLAAASLSLGAGGTIWEAAYLGSIAAAIQISRLGNLPLARNQLLEEIANARLE